jgi:cell division protein FtsQ
MTSVTIVRLAESDPGKSIETLRRLQREAHILDRDLLSIDLRASDRVIVRLTEEGAATRKALIHKPRRSGG